MVNNLDDINNRYLGDREIKRKGDIGYASVRADKEPEPVNFEELETYDSEEEPEPTNVEELETYDSEEEPQPISSYQYQSDGVVDSGSEITYALNDYKKNLINPEARLSDSSTVPEAVIDQDSMDSEKTKAGKFFGFIKNKFDIATDDFRQKNNIKNEAYREYMEQRPKVLADMYRQRYNQKLQKEMMPREQKMALWDQRFGQASSGMKKVGMLLGGSKNPADIIGMSSVRAPNPNIGMGGQGISSTNQQPLPKERPNIPPHNMQPSKYQEPGVTGSQVPKYVNAPSNSDPNAIWQRVVKIDRYGKKRSYLRKARAQDYNPNFKPQQQPQPQPQPQMNPMMQGIGFNINKLGIMSTLGGDNDFAMKANTLMGIGKKDDQGRFDPSKYL